MGTQNYAAVMSAWRELDHAAMRLLLHMAHVSLDPPGTDEQEPCLYFAGWESQALALGFTVPPDTASDTYSVMARANACRRVARARAALVRAGAIVLVKHSGPGHPARWRVVPEGASRTG